MDYKDWLIIKTISEKKTITKAAEHLYLSQPALSNRLKKIESEFDTKILLRNNNGVIFTPEGENLLAYVEKMLKEFTLTKERIKNMKSIVHGTLKLGTSSVFANYELPAILRGFIVRYPNIDIALRTGLSSKITKMLQKEECAVAVVRGDHFWPEEKLLLREEHLCLASAQPIEFHNLPSLIRINYGTDPSLKDVLQAWWYETFSRPPHIHMEVDSMNTCRQMILHNIGWGILPEIGLQEPNSLYSQKLYWRDGTPVLRRTWLMYQKSILELAAVNAFVNYVQVYYAAAENHDSIEKAISP